MDQPIRIMISSKVQMPLDPKDKASPSLSDVRQRLKAAIEESDILGDEQSFRVWINEDSTARDGTDNATQACLAEVRKADIVLVLYNGDAGWKTPGDIGICHAEYKTARDYAPASLRVIGLPTQSSSKGKHHREFRDEVEADNLFRDSAAGEEELVGTVLENIAEAIGDLVRSGAQAGRGASYYAGAPLQWARMDYDRRGRAMVEALRAFLDDQGAVPDDDGADRVDLEIAGGRVSVRLWAVPAAMSIGAARERVGQPFLRDHEDEAVVEGDSHGPLHLIACHQGVTEAQALRQLGFPDAMILAAPFGVYVADDVQRVQMAFLRECRDLGNTRQRATQFMEWLRDAGEDGLLLARAQRRTAIVRAMAA